MSEYLQHTLQATVNGSWIAMATLSAEKSLNALNLDMIEALYAQLRAWEHDPSVAMVLLQGAGEKAFCAGGDVRQLRESCLAAQGLNNPYAQDFFEQEYRLDYLIHTYPKPILLWGHGIVMGGGLGLMAGASHRVVTEKSRIAMPEITIGLYPDVGGTWFLNRMPGRTGLYLSLTGASLTASDALFLDLADFFIEAQQKNNLLNALQQAAWNQDRWHNHALLSKVLREFSHQTIAPLPASPVRAHYDFIQYITDCDSVLEIQTRLNEADISDTWVQKGRDALNHGSPTTAHMVFELYRRAKHWSLKEVFQFELGLSLQCCAHPDFPEGVRALLVDKDNQPTWQPATLAAVTPEWVAEHFSSPWRVETHPLRDL